ncbi:hypothetical protein ACQP3C_29190, partial [Escherichia coli]
SYEKHNTKIYMETQRLQIGRKVLRRKGNDGAITRSVLKLYPKAVVTKPSWNWNKRDIQQYKRIENP